jgi:hypothetical protein
MKVYINHRNPNKTGIYQTNIGERLYVTAGPLKGWFNGLRPLSEIKFWIE